MEHFDGETYEPQHDQVRLNAQLQRVWTIMEDGNWHTLNELVEKAGPGTVASISARLRDFRKQRFGGHIVERQRLTPGIFQYRLING